jgi:DNA-binding LytR/AlgR family response regulator
MKLLMVLCCICLALSAQTREQVDQRLILEAHLAYNDFAKLANKWSDQHSDYIMSREDSERLADAIKGWEKFLRLAKEAQLISKHKKVKEK